MIDKPSERIKKRRIKTMQPVLNVTSMVDILTIMLIFLLKSFTTGEVLLTPMEDLTLPNSSSEERINSDCLIVALTGEDIFVNNRRIGSYRDMDSNDPLLFSSLYSVLLEAAVEERAMADIGVSEAFKGRVVIQGHKEIPFEYLHRAMYTCAMAEFTDIFLATYYDSETSWAMHPDEIWEIQSETGDSR